MPDLKSNRTKRSKLKGITFIKLKGITCTRLKGLTCIMLKGITCTRLKGIILHKINIRSIMHTLFTMYNILASKSTYIVVRSAESMFEYFSKISIHPSHGVIIFIAGRFT